MKNPFNYLQFAEGDQFYDRSEMLADLKSRFLSGQTNVVLYGPRRYGKSSLVARLAESLEKEGMVCILFDLVKMPTIDIFAAAYATKVYRRLAPVKLGLNQISGFFKGLRPKVSIDQEGEASFSFEVAERGFSPSELTEILDLPQRLAGNRRILIILDEFQEVKDLLPNDGFERVMRSVMQAHRNVSYIFLGSRYHLLRRMFTDHNRPFYKAALTMLLDKPPFDESVSFVVSRFGDSGMAIPAEAAKKLVAKISNIPYYIQQLGFETFRIVDEQGRSNVTSEDVESAFSRLSGFNRDQYEQLMLTLSAIQKKLLLALAKEETDEFDGQYRSRHSLGASSSVNSAKKKLLEDGHIDLIDGQCRIADPLFAEYLRR